MKSDTEDEENIAWGACQNTPKFGGQRECAEGGRAG